MRNYMFDRVPAPERQGALAPARPKRPAVNGNRRRTVWVAALFLAVIAILTALVLILQRLNGDLPGDIMGQGGYEAVDPDFGILPDFFGGGSLSEEPLTTIPRADTGDGTVLVIQREREAPMTAQEIYAQAIDSIVSVTAYSQSAGSAGSGVIMSADGYIITNYHVIEGTQEAWVSLLSPEATQSGVYHYPAKLVGYYADLDIAVLKIDAQDLVAAQFGSSRDLSVGETAYALGNPMGYLYGTFTDGMISALNRTITVGGYEMTLLQTSAALNSGNSGGALLNECGQVVGITVAKIAPTDSVTAEGLGLAIPISEVRGIINSIIARGEAVVPVIGIQCYAVEADGRQGIYVHTVESLSPAAQAGLQVEDIILTANGQAVADVDALRDILYDNGLERPLDVTVLRGGEEVSLSFSLYAEK